MPKPKKHYAVILTSDAINFLKSEPIHIFLKDSRYFNCISVDTNDPHYINLVVETPSVPDISSHKLEISLPHYFVAYIASSASGKDLGFVLQQPSFDKDDTERH